MNKYTLIYIDTTQIDWNKKYRKIIFANNSLEAEQKAKEYCAKNEYAMHDLILSKKSLYGGTHV